MTVCYFVIVIGAFFTGVNIGNTLSTAATLSIFDVVMLHPSMSTHYHECFLPFRWWCISPKFASFFLIMCYVSSCTYSCMRYEIVGCPAMKYTSCNAVLLSVCLALDYLTAAVSVSIYVLSRCDWQFLYSSQDWPVPWSHPIAFVPLTYLAVCAF